MSRQTLGQNIDLELVGQRIVKLAEIAVLEHLEALARSQAQDLLDQVRQLEAKPGDSAASRGW